VLLCLFLKMCDTTLICNWIIQINQFQTKHIYFYVYLRVYIEAVGVLAVTEVSLQRLAHHRHKLNRNTYSRREETKQTWDSLRAGSMHTHSKPCHQRGLRTKRKVLKWKIEEWHARFSSMQQESSYSPIQPTVAQTAPWTTVKREVN